MECRYPGAARHGAIEANGLVGSGSLVVDLDDKQEVANLFIGDDHTELDIDTGGSLKILNMLEDSGAIVVGPTGEGGSDPSLKVHGSAYILSGGSISAHGKQSFVDFYRDFVEVAGSLPLPAEEGKPAPKPLAVTLEPRASFPPCSPTSDSRNC